MLLLSYLSFLIVFIASKDNGKSLVLNLIERHIADESKKKGDRFLMSVWGRFAGAIKASFLMRDQL